MNSTLSFISGGRPTDSARKEPSFVPGIKDCQTSITGNIIVRDKNIWKYSLEYPLPGLTYDVFKDTFKVYADGEKVESGSWSDNPNVKSENQRWKIFFIV